MWRSRMTHARRTENECLTTNESFAKDRLLWLLERRDALKKDGEEKKLIVEGKASELRR